LTKGFLPRITDDTDGALDLTGKTKGTKVFFNREPREQRRGFFATKERKEHIEGKNGFLFLVIFVIFCGNEIFPLPRVLCG
jgi:hypothetical protein